jgi:hypothetical protein
VGWGAGGGFMRPRSTDAPALWGGFRSDER